MASVYRFKNNCSVGALLNIRCLSHEETDVNLIKSNLIKKHSILNVNLQNTSRIQETVKYTFFLAVMVVLVIIAVSLIKHTGNPSCAPSDSDAEGHYTCDPSTGAKICRPGYEGALCKIEINECDSSPCQNGGICTNHVNYFTCNCLPGTTGDKCEVILECASGPCENNATCQDLVNSYACVCPLGFTGSRCELDINECASGPCENNATCQDLINSYACVCPLGFTGSRCELDINECASGPCRNHGVCHDHVNYYTCECRSGYEGSQCEHHINNEGSKTTARQGLTLVGWFWMLIFTGRCLGN